MVGESGIKAPRNVGAQSRTLVAIGFGSRSPLVRLVNAGRGLSVAQQFFDSELGDARAAMMSLGSRPTGDSPGFSASPDGTGCECGSVCWCQWSSGCSPTAGLCGGMMSARGRRDDTHRPHLPRRAGHRLDPRGAHRPGHRHERAFPTPSITPADTMTYTVDTATDQDGGCIFAGARPSHGPVPAAEPAGIPLRLSGSLETANSSSPSVVVATSYSILNAGEFRHRRCLVGVGWGRADGLR